MQPATVALVLPGDSGCTWSMSRGECGVACREGRDGLPERGDGQVPRVAHRGEPGHVAPLDRAVHRRPEGFHVGNVNVVDVDAFLGEQRRQLAQLFLCHAGFELESAAARAVVAGRGGACRPWAHPHSTRLLSLARLALAVIHGSFVIANKAWATRTRNMPGPRQHPTQRIAEVADIGPVAGQVEDRSAETGSVRIG